MPSKSDLERQFLEATCAAIGRTIVEAVNESTPVGQSWGFALLMFDFGERGTLAYLSNAARDDMIKVLDECRRKLIEGRQ